MLNTAKLSSTTTKLSYQTRRFQAAAKPCWHHNPRVATTHSQIGRSAG
ncbi:hypothetical protein [Campylobacter rectus]|nr:hypothetical protein [Campylobacter rectus]